MIGDHRELTIESECISIREEKEEEGRDYEWGREGVGREGGGMEGGSGGLWRGKGGREEGILKGEKGSTERREEVEGGRKFDWPF